ncbi:U6 snRNA-associated Sm-like protein LSm4 [Echinococcus granulosus]|uniref:U6 snRNA-associated Sm-like protein LSm4 n=2 Tax=Echinococcus granulosus TaxID=6210 RepID=W6UR24_ECHGR|nr:U6 snRNA-associated Sm-like protein LSm4 [Echinococcus granulosus]EUB60767.1 U6 snRNA-associated Sm-like protein LSm4 [Echinococcus granulosus]
MNLVVVHQIFKSQNRSCSVCRVKQRSIVAGRFNMLPITLLKASCNMPMLVELKSGETYNGYLIACDDWMNIHLKEVICTSRDGDRFWKMPECFIRGSIIKYLRIPEDVIDKVKEDMQASRVRNRELSGRGGGGSRNKFRGGRGGGGSRGGGKFGGNRGK